MKKQLIFLLVIWCGFCFGSEEQSVILKSIGNIQSNHEKLIHIQNLLQGNDKDLIDVIAREKAIEQYGPRYSDEQHATIAAMITSKKLYSVRLHLQSIMPSVIQKVKLDGLKFDIETYIQTTKKTDLTALRTKLNDLNPTEKKSLISFIYTDILGNFAFHDFQRQAAFDVYKMLNPNSTETETKDIESIQNAGGSGTSTFSAQVSLEITY